MLFMMMRINFKTLVALLAVAILSSFLTSIKNCRSSVFYEEKVCDGETRCKEITCLINGKKNVTCRKDKNEVFVPFSFIQNYFEINGRIVTIHGIERLEWYHSYSKIIDKQVKYDSKGVFMTFENYNVELRDRVKCISGKDGVPISTQWESRGYYYPTQIAQFGLSHYSKSLIEPKSVKIVIEDAEFEIKKWIVPANSEMNRVYEKRVSSFVVSYLTQEIDDSSIFMELEILFKLVLKLDLCIKDNSSITVQIQLKETKKTYFVHYISSDFVLRVKNNHIFYGIGSVHYSWRRMTRDLMVDLQKGLSLIDRNKKKLPRSKLKVVKIILKGSGMIDNLTLSSSEHMEQFYDAAQWFVANQNISSGGWPNFVKRKVATGMAVLEPGWYSSMGQGHALSVLSRAYHHSGEMKYLEAAVRGLQPFQVPSNEGGIATRFLDKYIWYEEYPTMPSSFILNGFMYSLIGLYDLKSVATDINIKKAEILFEQGIVSLKNMLTLFDTGAGTTYDLRHFTLKTAPNLARWDYHSTHINQLILLNSINKNQIFTSTIERWIEYMNGKKAAHN